MSIRIRVVDGITVAICAARSVPKPGDIYLDDRAHHALSGKFAEDFASQGYNTIFHKPAATGLRAREESNNPAREWWDRTYASAPAPLPACRARFDGWVCTLEPGHAGDHRAAGDLAQDTVYAVWPASVGLIEDPHAPRVDVDAPRWVNGYYFDPAKFKVAVAVAERRPVPRNYDRPLFPLRILDHLIEAIGTSPDRWAPQNSHYRKSDVNAPGTVRSWFRKMRAADFERDVARTVFGTFYIAIDQKPWTLFDTQTVVNRETAAYYLQPARDTIYFCNGGRVVGKIEGIDWSDISTCHERGGQPEWDMTDYRRDVQWLGLDRSNCPAGSGADLTTLERSAVPEFNAHRRQDRGITLDDVKRFVSDDDLRRIGRSALQRAREDDARRSERRRQDGPADQFMAWLLRETDAGAWDPSVVAEVRDHLASLIRRSAAR